MAKWHWKSVPMFWEILGPHVFKGFAKLFVPFGPLIPSLVIYPTVVIPNRRNVFIIQSLSRAQLFATPWTAARQASLSITNSWSLLKLMSIESVMPSNHPILSCPLLLPPSIFPGIRAFSDDSVFRIRWPKYWSFSFSISPCSEYSVLISLRTDSFDLLTNLSTLKNLLQHYSSKAWILQCSVFITVQLWHPYMTTGKTIALTIQTFVSKVMSLLFILIYIYLF